MTTKRFMNSSALGSSPALAARLPQHHLHFMNSSALGSSPALAARLPQHHLQAEEAKTQARKRAISEEFARLAAEHGDIVTQTRITYDFGNTFSLGLLEWQRHGIAGTSWRKVSIDAANWFEDRKVLRDVLKRKLGKYLEHQATLAQKYGGRAVQRDARRIDLSLYRIEKPVLAALDLAHRDDGGEILRKALHEGPEGTIAGEKLLKVIGGSISLDVRRALIAGRFEIKTPKHKLVWSKGSLNIKDATLPSVALSALVGDRLGHVLNHPLFDPDMVITSIHVASRDSGRASVAITLKECDTTMPASWA